ncbi:MAG: flagellar M-ring protein FliF [Clostridia bacterium]|nr:flagellar M-ring protein FliF [Clostridia bacterium]
MESFWEQFRGRFLQTWGKMNITQKVVVIGAGMTILFTLFVLGKMAAKPDMVPLFTNLTNSDAGAIMSRLEELATPYQLADGGTTILVPNRDKDRLRIQLAMDDLPRRGVVGFESWNETRFGETDTDKRVRLLVALQGELTRTIESLEEVESARVHIAIPEPKLFTSDATAVTASIMVKLRPFSELNSNQVLAIMRLIANSVEDLSPEQVVVIDTNMNILSEGINETSSPTAAKLTANQLQLKEQFENNLAKSVQSMLERALGYGSVVVRISADLNFDEVEQRSQIFGKNVIRSESSLEETSRGTNPLAGGEVGLDANAGLVELNTATSEYERNERIRNYEVDVFEEYIKKSPGAVNHLSVSVIVDTGEAGELEQGLRDSIKNIVASASGTRADRNDVVEVIGMPFNTKAYDEMQARMDVYQRQMKLKQLITYGLLSGMVLLGGFLLIRVGKANKSAVKQRQQLEQVVEQRVQLTPEEKERDLVKKQIVSLAKEKPSELAHLLKTWMADDSR